MMMRESTTETAWAATVAMAAPATFMWKTATRSRSPKTLPMQAMRTNKRGVLESPRPRKTAAITL